MGHDEKNDHDGHDHDDHDDHVDHHENPCGHPSFAVEEKKTCEQVIKNEMEGKESCDGVDPQVCEQFVQKLEKMEDDHDGHDQDDDDGHGHDEATTAPSEATTAPSAFADFAQTLTVVTPLLAVFMCL